MKYLFYKKGKASEVFKALQEAAQLEVQFGGQTYQDFAKRELWMVLNFGRLIESLEAVDFSKN